MDGEPRPIAGGVLDSASMTLPPSNRLPWAQVAKIHRTSGGVAVRDGRVSSLLCSERADGAYTDVIDGDAITYHFGCAFPTKAGLVHFQTIRDAFDAALTEQSPVATFKKNDVNDWTLLGDFRVVQVDVVEEHRIAVRLRIVAAPVGTLP